MDKAVDVGGSASSNSSDFVRKLYKMLEDPSYENLVRWSDSGDSFVVVESDKFTKDVLPQHFKHSNFASFVRQLNKYDFHKIRQNSEDTPGSGQNQWEFKHEDFARGKKDNLDSIKRKAPAPRRPAMDDQFPGQQIELLNSQMIATSHQLQHIQERYNALFQDHVVLLDHVVQLQKIVKNHEGAMHRVMGFLHTVDEQRRHSRIDFAGNGTPAGATANNEIYAGLPADDHPASPLQQASQLLGEFSAENLMTKDLEQLTQQYAFRNDVNVGNDQSGMNMGPAPGAGPQMGFGQVNDLDSVYPMGNTDGIDPSEHANNIPYGLPPNGLQLGAQNGMAPMRAPAEMRKKSVIELGWNKKPRILLVEDDKTCARIGTKFLQTFECSVEIARDGLEAVNTVNNFPGQFDLIFMDIIMPQLDGVSATVCIREVQPDIPIIAMTSNVRNEDCDMYVTYGMNEILPKPFKKEGMLRILEKHLAHLRKDPQAPPQSIQQGGHQQVPPQIQLQQQVGYAPAGALPQSAMNMNMAHVAAGQPMKDKASPGQSPASSWHSPNQLSGVSPVNTTPQGNFVLRSDNTYGVPTPTHPNFPQNAVGMPATNTAQPRQGAHRRVMSDMTANPEDFSDAKRQRMYPGNYTQ